ncbi:hypothetical protein ACOMHN_046387 [Nucella lapillus]
MVLPCPCSLQGDGRKSSQQLQGGDSFEHAPGDHDRLARGQSSALARGRVSVMMVRDPVTRLTSLRWFILLTIKGQRYFIVEAEDYCPTKLKGDNGQAGSLDLRAGSRHSVQSRLSPPVPEFRRRACGAESKPGNANSDGVVSRIRTGSSPPGIALEAGVYRGNEEGEGGSEEGIGPITKLMIRSSPHVEAVIAIGGQIGVGVSGELFTTCGCRENVTTPPDQPRGFTDGVCR